MIKFKKESYDEIVDDIVELLEDHWKEVEWNQDKIPFNPHLEAYELSDEAGIVAMFTMRDDDELVGYATYWIYQHPHHRGVSFAANDMLYILPSYRHSGYAQNLVYFCEQNLKDSGVNVITYSMKKDHRFEDLMGSSGYEHTECVYSKYVG